MTSSDLTVLMKRAVYQESIGPSGNQKDLAVLPVSLCANMIIL